MNRISHKQALQWIDRRLDGLLTQKQLLVLDEHLRSCDACRAYAAEMDQLPARLQNELHARWDEKPGPSPKIMQHVTTKAGHNPMKNHTYSASELFAGALMLIGLAFALNFFVSQLQNTFAAANGTEVADAPSRSQEQLIAFVSTQSGNSDIYTMQTDGSAVTNLTNDPGEDIYPVWSPDGNRIAFISNRDGSDQLYVMDADGSNHTRLTKDPVSIIVPTFSPDGTKDVLPVWSPDSTRIAYAAQDPAGHVSNIYIVDIAGQNRRLTDTDPQTTMLWPEAWSLDGQYLFFHMNSLFWKADTNTGDIAGLTAVAELTLQLVLSKDGSNFLYLDWCGQSDLPKFCAWVATMNQDKTNAKLNATVELQNVCQSEELLPALFIDYHNTIKWSPDRTKILFAFYCKENGGSLYIANADGSDFKPLLNYPVLYKAALFDWSPDSQSIVFSSALDNAESASTYILNINDALQNPDLRPEPLNTSAEHISFFAWQPGVDEAVLEENPTPEPNQTASHNNLIAFASTQSGNSDIYTMQTDGSAVTNLTNDPGEDIYPVWSPDGNHIAFVSNREGNYQLYVMGADGSNLTRLAEDPVSTTAPVIAINTRPSGTKDVLPVWSPDSTRIAYAAQDPAGHVSNIYTVDMTGQTRRLTDGLPETAQIWTGAWSADSQYLFIHRELSVFRINANTGEVTPVLPMVARAWELALSKDGSKLLFLGLCTDGTFCLEVNSADQDGKNVKYYTTLQIQEVCPSTAPLSSIKHNEIIKWSPDRTKILFAFYCEENGGPLYIANADGSNFKPLTNYPILFKGSGFDWSPDGQAIVFSSALDNAQSESFYLLNIDEALQNPEVRPTGLGISAAQISSIDWQPIP